MSTSQGVALSFRNEVSIVETSDERVLIVAPWARLPVRVTAGLLDALRILSTGGATEDAISDVVLATDGAAALPVLYYELHRFSTLRFLSYTVVDDGQPLAGVVPMTAGLQLSAKKIRANSRFQLSRFAYCRREGDSLVLESPLSSARAILLNRKGAAVVAALAQPLTARDLCSSVDGLTEVTASNLLSLLVNTALVAEVRGDGALPEDDDPALVQWQFHDLLFHSRSRMGRHDYAMGGIFPFLGRIPPLPASKPITTGETIPLFKPELRRLELEDRSFTSVLEKRKSVRSYQGAPIHIRQLGEFLYRAARVRRVLDADPARERHYQASSRPYPSGGATYDLEVYVAVHTCTDVDAGLYHYDPVDHQICRIAPNNEAVQRLLRHARAAGELGCDPQVLIVLTSRFQRVSWKYSGFAYAMTLKNVGVLYQTMYLVATAMGLAPCALGAGDSDLFSQAAGTDYFAESSVGEFLLGNAAG